MSLETPAAPAAPLPVLETEQDILARAKQATARRKRNIWLLRLAIVVVWLGSWELTATYWIDPFFYSKPSKIWERLVEWFTTGTD
ncbi:MAG TPA: ABC transporter permease, partial [Amycolatopsis sp.]|nr:ABC transporter permease [Amycolatopsis sp.]